MDDSDYALALKLQQQFDEEHAQYLDKNNRNKSVSDYGSKNKTQDNDTNVIYIEDDYEVALKLQNELNGHETKYQVTDTIDKITNNSWELMDPNPDVFALFVEFDRKFFWGKLASVEVSWSNKMTLCAGVCEFHGHKSGMCRIKLSEPLLKFRPRKDMLETLLHEMIHAYLFLTNNDRDRDGHGPQFQKHMHRLNCETGLNVTIYHTFHDEVAVYQQHWWKCNGPCQRFPPYYGMVKRSMNRAPSAKDPWWAQHQVSCGGTYEKVKEPENYGNKKRKLEDATLSDNKKKIIKIDSFFNKTNKPVFSADKALTNQSSNIHTLSSINNTSVYKPLTFNDDSKSKLAPKVKFNFINRDEGLQKGLIGQKRKSESAFGAASSEWPSSEKVIKIDSDDDDGDDEPSKKDAANVDLSDIWNGTKAKINQSWPKCFPSELKISTLAEGELQLRMGNLKVGETIVIPNFVSVTKKGPKRIHKKLIIQ